MTAKLAELRKQAKEMGIAPGIIRGCNTADELQSVIAGFGGEDTPAKPRKKSAVKKAAAVKKATAKKSGNSKSASSKKAPAAKSAKSGKAKRPSAAKASTKGTDGPSGRHLLNGVDFSNTDGWNPREGSPPDRIVKALKRFKGNRSKVFDHLSGDVWDFVGKKKADGSKRGKADAEAMLRYRISRTAFDFAVRTGQHEPSDNRVTYGTGGTGEGVFKRKGKGNSKPASSKKASASKPAKKQARKGTTAKASKAKTTKSGKKKAKAGKK